MHSIGRKISLRERIFPAVCDRWSREADFSKFETFLFGKERGSQLMLTAAVYGFVVGDALGVPYLKQSRGTFLCREMIGFGTAEQFTGYLVYQYLPVACNHGFALSYGYFSSGRFTEAPATMGTLFRRLSWNQAAFCWCDNRFGIDARGWSFQCQRKWQWFACSDVAVCFCSAYGCTGAGSKRRHACASHCAGRLRHVYADRTKSVGMAGSTHRRL